MNTRDRRRHNRVEVKWLARVGRKDLGVSRALVRNISIGGVYLECSQAFALESQLLIELHAEHNGETRKILSEGMVVHVETLAGERHGYGIKMLRIRDDDLFYLLAVVADLWAGGARA
jgi:hypothetical protein